MFEMNGREIQAFKDAARVAPSVFRHWILFAISALATVWLLMIFIGVMKNSDRPISDSLYDFAFALFIYTTIGVVVYY